MNMNKLKKPRFREKIKRQARKLVLGATLLVAGAFGSACGDKITNITHNCHRSDGGAATDMLKPDSGVLPDTLASDTLKPDACVADTSCTVTEEKATIEITIPPKAGSTSPAFNIKLALKEGESYTNLGVTFKIKSIDATVANHTTCSTSDKKVTLEITDSNGTTQITMGYGESITVSGVTVKALGIHIGVNGFHCSESMIFPPKTVFNQGDSFNFGKYTLVFEDGQQVGDKVYALLSINDSCGNSVTKLKVGESEMSASMLFDGQHVEFVIDQVAISTSTKWANISLHVPCKTVPQTCVGNLDPLKCSDTVPLVSGTLNQGGYLNIESAPGKTKFRLQLDDGQVLNGNNYAIVSLIDSCGNIIKKDKLQEGSTKTFVVNGESLDVTVNSAAFGMTFGAKWANFTVNAPCSKTYWCTSISGILNQDDSLSFDNYEVKLDDLHAQGTLTSALLSVLDSNNNILTKLKIAEGNSADVILGGKTIRINVPEVAPGYTFGAKWAKIEIQSPFSKPCGS
jgi:hypothetical protein